MENLLEAGREQEKEEKERERGRDKENKTIRETKDNNSKKPNKILWNKNILDILYFSVFITTI